MRLGALRLREGTDHFPFFIGHFSLFIDDEGSEYRLQSGVFNEEPN
jgi:hypothetical protein